MAFNLAARLNQQKDFNVMCKVVLLPEKSYYAPGDFIEGKLVVTPAGKDSRPFNGIRVTLQGSSFAKFKERGQTQHKTETFLDEGTYVFGGARERTFSKLPPGTTTYPFQLQIPSTSQLPSSFKTPIGMVIYQVLAILDVGAQLQRQFLTKGEKTICIHGSLELGAEERGIRFRSSGSGPKYGFRTESSSFVLGREIGFEMCTEAGAGGAIRAGFVSLVQKVTYYGGTITHAWKDTFTVVGEVANEEVGERWKSSLAIRKDLPATFTGGVVEFRYLLKVIMETAEGQMVKLERPIKLGTHISGEITPSLSSQFAGLTLPEFPNYNSDGTRRVSLISHPPEYSALSTRSSSFETLPPEYHEIQEHQELFK